MANQKARQGGGSQSIVRHPLFPTVVAFWFAALFGLGSLAVRTSLLESLVIASRIDLIVPQTAPPLGITARILIALAMAAIGSIIGFILALRLARPRQERQERVRTARGFGGRASEASSRDSDYEEERTAEPERRRALIASNEGADESIFDDGPSFLTGMSPHILDVTEFDFDPIDQQAAEPEEPAQPLESAPALELDQFATVAPTPTPAPGFETFAAPQAVVAPAPASEVQAAPFAQPAEVPADSVAETQRAFAAPAEQQAESFAAPAATPFSAPVLPAQAPQEEAPAPEIAPEAQAAPATSAFFAPVTSPLQFNVGPAVAAARAPVQPAAGPASVPVEPAPAQDAPVATAETEDDNPLAAFRNKVAPLPVFDREPDVSYDLVPEEAAIDSESAADPEPAVEAEAAAVPEASVEPLSVSTQLAVPMGAAAERLMNANLSDLSPVELVERLALSLQRRGQAVTLSRLPVSQPAPAPAVTVQPAPAPVPAPAPAASETPAEAARAEAHSRLTLPAAMRPIDFSQYEHEEDLPAYVPARSIAMPSPEAADQPEQAEPQPAAQPAAPQDAPAMPRFGRPVESEEPAAQGEDEVLEAGYSSLLNMSKPLGQRQQFVRVIDPEAETEAAEPVVIFPGQTMRAGTRFSAPSEGPVVAHTTPPPSLAEAQPRRFDVPPVPAQPAASRNPEETERALRSALSTLQRMSGVA